jgi:hypothetical protein
VQPASVPIIAVRRGLPDYCGPAIPWPAGWKQLWRANSAPVAGGVDTVLEP